MKKPETMGAIDPDGKYVEMDPQLMRHAINEILEEGEIVAAVVRKGDAVVVKMFFSPDEIDATAELAESLQDALNALRAIIAKQGH